MIVVIAAVVHLRRDSIARDVANSILEERGFVATEIEVDTLTPTRLELDLLVIESASGARYEIKGLVVPLSVTGGKIDRVAADSLTVSYDTARDSQAMLSTTLTTVFELPIKQPGVQAGITSIKLPGLPELRNARWQTNVDGQSASFLIDDIDVSAVATRDPDDVHHLLVHATDRTDSIVLYADIGLARPEQTFRATGELAVSLAAWRPTLQELALVPARLQNLDAKASGSIQVEFDDVAPGNATAKLQLDIGDASLVGHVADNGRTTTFVVASTDPLAIEFAYPASDWIARASTVGGIFSTDGLSDTLVMLRDLECRTGVTCTLNAIIETQPIEWNDYIVDAASLSLPLTVNTGDPTRVQIGPTAGGEFSGLRSAGIDAAIVTITGFSGTEVIVDDDGWRCQIDTLQLAFDGLAATTELLISPGITLSDLNIGDSGETLAAEIEISAPFDGVWKGMALSLPGAAGTFSLQGDELLANVDIVDLADAIAGNVALRRTFDTAGGSLKVSDGWASFDRARLSDYAPGWKLPFDILRGTWDVGLELEWQRTNDAPGYSGNTRMVLDSVGGTYNDIAMVGLSTELAATIEPSGGLTISPSPVSMRLLDVGVPIENITFDYAVDLKVPAIEVHDLGLELFGGTVQADPFTYSPAAETNDIMLHARSIQLQLMVDTLEFDSIELTGSMSGDLPIAMRGNSITISDGQMQSDADGGTIRYGSVDDALGSVAPDSGLGAVTQALTNFEFESLNSIVDYVEGGDMTMQMRLVGVNPDLDPDQPYAFNLNLENNIPQMLRSLRAVRSIEDILKQRTEN